MPASASSRVTGTRDCKARWGGATGGCCGRRDIVWVMADLLLLLLAFFGRSADASPAAADDGGPVSAPRITCTMYSGPDGTAHDECVPDGPARSPGFTLDG